MRTIAIATALLLCCSTADAGWFGNLFRRPTVIRQRQTIRIPYGQQAPQMRRVCGPQGCQMVPQYPQPQGMQPAPAQDYYSLPPVQPQTRYVVPQ